MNEAPVSENHPSRRQFLFAGIQIAASAPILFDRSASGRSDREGHEPFFTTRGVVLTTPDLSTLDWPRRSTPDSAWGAPVKLDPPVNGSDNDNDGAQVISANGLSLYFASSRPGGYGSWGDLWVTRRATVNDDWGPPVNLGPLVNGPREDFWPGISPDGLVLFFSSNRPGGYASIDVYMARRATRKDPWGPPVNLGAVVNGSSVTIHAKVSDAGSLLYFSSNRPGGVGGFDIWQAPIVPVVDFDADGKVDLLDLTLLIGNWATNDTLYDIGPYAGGDGKVDIEDLKVFIAEWEKVTPTAEP